MVSRGVVREWSDAEGWGVIDGDDVPGGCRAHFSDVRVAGYRTLTPGSAVMFEWERFDQDGFSYRATASWPAGADPVDPDPAVGGSSAMSSTVTITYKDGSTTKWPDG